jgi:uncharacterized membrane protein YjjP (DUF1212 family)
VNEEIRKRPRRARAKRWLQVLLWLVVLGGAALAVAGGVWQAGAVAIFVLLLIVGTLEWRN